MCLHRHILSVSQWIRRRINETGSVVSSWAWSTSASCLSKLTRQNIQYCCVFLMNRPLPKWLFLFLAGARALVLKWLELSIQLPLPCLLSFSYITAFCLVDNIAEFDFFLYSLAISCYLEVFIWHLILFLIWTAYLISTLYSFYWLVCTSVFTTHL